MALDMTYVPEDRETAAVAALPSGAVHLWFFYLCPHHDNELQDQIIFEDVIEMTTFLKRTLGVVEPIMAYSYATGNVLGARELHYGSAPVDVPLPEYDYPRPTPEKRGPYDLLED